MIDGRFDQHFLELFATASTRLDEDGCARGAFLASTAAIGIGLFAPQVNIAASLFAA